MEFDTDAFIQLVRGLPNGDGPQSHLVLTKSQGLEIVRDIEALRATREANAESDLQKNLVKKLNGVSIGTFVALTKAERALLDAGMVVRPERLP